MALIKCPECGREISDQAVSCPHCGFPLSKIKESEEERKKEEFQVIATRSNQRGIHITLFILAGLALGTSIIFFTFALVFLYSEDVLPIRIFLFVTSGILLFASLFISIQLSIWRSNNAKVPRHVIYYSGEKEEFIFYDIHGNIYTVKKETPFSLRNNMRNYGELLLFYLNRKINLGFTNTPIDQINNAIIKIRDKK